MKKILVTGGSGFIGMNLIDGLLARGHERIINIDRVPPRVNAQKDFWRDCDILDCESVKGILQETCPRWIVHLAGRTDMNGMCLSEYGANHIGTGNVVEAIRCTPSVERVIFISSQFVVKPGALVKDDAEYCPHTVYGESKAKAEDIVRNSELSCAWTIGRPTNIWGMWHPRYPSEFWRILKQGLYIHPTGGRVLRCYGYVGTVVDQIYSILSGDSEKIDKATFYLGDAPIDLYDWTNAFSLELTGHPVRTAPRVALRALAIFGDVVSATGRSFPIFSSRYRSMTESYLTPMDKTFANFGFPSTSLKEGVQATVAWLRTRDPFWA